MDGENSQHGSDPSHDKKRESDSHTSVAGAMPSTHRDLPGNKHRNHSRLHSTQIALGREEGPDMESPRFAMGDTFLVPTSPEGPPAEEDFGINSPF